VIVDLIAEAKADGLGAKRACKVLGLSPRTVQRWKSPVQPLVTMGAANWLWPCKQAPHLLMSRT